MLFLIALISFLVGVLAALSLPYLQNRQACRWKELIKTDIAKEHQKTFEEKENELFEKEKKIELAEQKLAKIESENLQLQKRKKELLGGDDEEVAARLLNHLEERVRKENQHHLANLRKEGEREAKSLLIAALHRLSPVEVTPLFSEIIPVQDETLRRRIVGPEGKNIHFLEEKLGVKLILEKELVLTSVDPEKRFFSKKVIESLLEDGKIFPKRIEEVIEKVALHLEGEIRKVGEKACSELGLSLPHPSISHILGKLSFRYSFGQNLLEHSKEVATILGNIAAELHLSVAVGKRIGLFHDIGKALVQSPQSHAIAGMEFLKAHGESEAVSNGVGCHHFEVEPLTQIGSFCHLADAISAGREGARLEHMSVFARKKE